MSTNVYKIEVMVIDFDGLGRDEIKSVLENTHYPNRCISPSVKRIDTRAVDWSDSHPLNMRDQEDEAYKKLFDDTQPHRHIKGKAE